MDRYQGSALLFLDDGQQFATEVDLTRDGGDWYGILTLPLADRTAALLNHTEGALQIAGREGRFVRPDTSDWTRSSGDLLRFRIAGHGNAPF